MKAAKKAKIETQFKVGIASECNPLLVDLVWQTDPELFHFFYGGDQSLLQKLFTAEWSSAIGFFSHANMTIATRTSGPVGLLNCFPGKRMGEIYQSHIQLVPSVLEADATARLLRGLVAMGWLFPFVPGDALYVLNLVVSEKVRGAGIGAKLMAIAEEKAKSEGLKSIHLDTSTTSNAIKFYQDLGYQSLVETRLCQLRDDETLPSHYRMVKSLT
jgi:ribosomal protein S18 acetylase RimI-like enzyme